MKYIINKDQHKIIADNMALVIKSHFSESTWICDVTVFPTETDEDDAMFDIYVHLKLSELKKFNDSAAHSISLSIKHKVMEYLNKWFSLKDDDFFVGTLAKDC